MMRNGLLALCFQFFHQIVQEEVNQNGVNLDIWMISLDLPPDQLHAPYTTSFSVCQLKSSGVKWTGSKDTHAN